MGTIDTIHVDHPIAGKTARTPVLHDALHAPVEKGGSAGTSGRARDFFGLPSSTQCNKTAKTLGILGHRIREGVPDDGNRVVDHHRMKVSGAVWCSSRCDRVNECVGLAS